MWTIFYNIKGNKFVAQSSFRSTAFSITVTAKEIQNKTWQYETLYVPFISLSQRHSNISSYFASGRFHYASYEYNDST